MNEKRRITLADLVKINEYLFEIPASFRSDMRVPARVYMTATMFDEINEDTSLQQLVNITTLPGIKKHALAMPDIHQGYGFPIGGVAATAIDHGGVISPGGIGYDINCGVRLLVANTPSSQVLPLIEKLATALYNAVPSGVGRGGIHRYTPEDLTVILQHGAKALVERGYGNEQDLLFCEEGGSMDGANPDLISDRARHRAHDQLGTLGSGNHFLEIQVVEKIYDDAVARIFGLEIDMVTVMIHCGSRGLGHQVCTDFVRNMDNAIEQFGFSLPDRELACAPCTSAQGRDYYAAMVAAANFAWANRHMIGHMVRKAWQEVMGSNATLHTLYDVSHNIGKQEKHLIEGKRMNLMVHRKGATRAFGPHSPELPERYASVGQPVLIPGTMGTSSYVLVGAADGLEQSFGSSCHGAGRRMSRTKAKAMIKGKELRKHLQKLGITVRCDSESGLAEEAPRAYKDIDQVVEVVHGAGLAYKVARMRPIAVIKG